MTQNSNQCSIQDKVEFLSWPDAYPAEHPDRIEVVETHMSWVFLTDFYVYKLKKPVRYSFLDFSTLEARGRYCAAEVRLNRRLAPETYLGTLPLSLDASGQLTVGDGGAVVDWVVHMRRLPEDRMLERVIEEDRLEHEDIDRVAWHLANFYARCEPVWSSPESYRRHLLKAAWDNLDAVSEPIHEQDQKRIQRILEAQTDLLTRFAPQFEARAAQGHIVEGHGDLRPEHVCLEQPPVIFDCLEFNRRLRTQDAVDDMGSLAMECDRLGAPQVGEVLFQVYGTRTGDWPEDEVINFYKSCQACLRAKLALWHIFELPRHEWQPWREKAEGYLDLAEGYLRD